MKDLTLETLIAVFEEMFGAWAFWLLVGAALVVTLAYLYVLVRDRSISMKKFFWAQVAMPVGAIVAVAIVLRSTRSQLADLGGPVDVMVFLAIAAIGAIGISILVYTVQSIVWRPRR